MPPAGFTGSDTFTYSIADSQGLTDQATVSITGDIVDGEGTGTITNDDTTSLHVNDILVDEGAGTATFTVTLSSALSALDTAVDYATNDGTATAGMDYVAITGTLTILAGSRAATVDVPIIDDDVEEGPETFTVTLSAPVNALLGDGEGTGTIQDNDIVTYTLFLPAVFSNYETAPGPVAVNGDAQAEAVQEAVFTGYGGGVRGVAEARRELAMPQRPISRPGHPGKSGRATLS